MSAEASLPAAQPSAAEEAVSRDLCLLTANILLHIVQIDRQHARRVALGTALGVPTQ
jgi:hypothetical protein